MNNPLHPYTKALISAVPEYKKVNDDILEGEIPSPLNPPKGCYFCTRCPVAEKKCFSEIPDLEMKKEGRFVACHLVS